LESFIFIDDSALECEEVQTNCPEVLVLHCPAESEDVSWLEHVWAFDHWAVKQSGPARTEQYRQNRARKELRNEATSFEEFLARLELQVVLEPVRENELERVAELTYRTNQFNANPQPRQVAQLRRELETGEIWSIYVEDRFGAYGLTG